MCRVGGGGAEGGQGLAALEKALPTVQERASLSPVCPPSPALTEKGSSCSPKLIPPTFFSGILFKQLLPLLIPSLTSTSLRVLSFKRGQVSPILNLRILHPPLSQLQRNYLYMLGPLPHLPLFLQPTQVCLHLHCPEATSL